MRCCDGTARGRALDTGGEAANGYKMTPLYGPEAPCDLDRLVQVYAREVEAESDPLLRDIAAILRETRRRGIDPSG